MRTAHHQPRTIIARDGGGCRGRQTLPTLQRIRHPQQILIGERPAKQRHAPRQAVAHEAGGHGDGGVIEQVHEVGVVAQFRVAQYRFGRQFRQGHRAADGWGEHAIESVQRLVAQGLQGLQAILGTEGLHAAHRRRLGQHRANHRQHGFGILRHQLAGDAVALGHPRPFVEQSRRFQKRRQIQRHRLTTQRGELIDGTGE
ncbi:hypothetical protein D3C84_789840 [compost metagenome]